jgi:hypothetical protein
MALLAADGAREALRRDSLSGVIGVELLGDDGPPVTGVEQRMLAAAGEVGGGLRVVVGEAAATAAGSHRALRALGETGLWELGPLGDGGDAPLPDAPPEA